MFIAPNLLAAILTVCGAALAISPPDPKTLYTSTTKLNATDTIMAGLPMVPGVTHVQLHSGSAKGRTYAHHAITEYIDNTLYVAWSSGKIDEDQMGQQSWVAKGALQSNGSWTFGSPRIVLPSALLSNQTSESNYTYWCSSDITQRGSQPNSFVKYGSAVYAVIEAVDITCFNNGASKYTRGAGRYVISVSSDTSTGCWLTQNSYWTEHQWKNTPSGIGKSLCAEPLKSELTTLLNRPDIQPMTNEKLINVGSYYAPDGMHTLQEVTHAVWFDDGTNTGKGYWQRFWRDTSGTNNTLFSWVEYTTSVNGSDWFPAVVQSGTNKIQQTNIPDSNTKAFYGSVGLASGPATYLVHNPQYYPDTRWRQPLAIAVAHDRIHFDQDRVIRTNASLTFVADTRGVKRVGLSYPHATVAGNELLVVYSEDKENIWMTRVPLSSLSGLVSTTTTSGTSTTTTSTSTSSSTTTTSTTTTSSSSGSGDCTSAQWAQCGGIGWVGCTKCATGLTCTTLNDYYYQCL